jgi:hypothetical protein
MGLKKALRRSVIRVFAKSADESSGTARDRSSGAHGAVGADYLPATTAPADLASISNLAMSESAMLQPGNRSVSGRLQRILSPAFIDHSGEI